MRSTIIGFEKIGVEGILTKGLALNSQDTMGRVASLDLYLIKVTVGESAIIKLNQDIYDDVEMLKTLGYSEQSTLEATLKIGEYFDFRGFRVNLKSVKKSFLPTGSEQATVVVDLITPPDAAFSKLRIGGMSSLLHPRNIIDFDWYGIEIAAPRIVFTENKIVVRDHFHGLAPSAARVMLAGSWHLERKEIERIQRSKHKQVQDTAMIIVEGPGENNRQEFSVEQLLADIGDKHVRYIDYDQLDDDDPTKNYPTSWGGYFTIDLGDKIATVPNAQGIFKVWAELDKWKSSELTIELKPQ
jgi:hypothetical protein